MRTPRRPRRSGIRYIEDANSRSISFSKRRDGLFKMAANLCTLTGARIAIVAEAENGKMSGFSAPSFGPIMDAFLSGEEEAGARARAPEGPDEREKDAIARLQRELTELEEKKAAQEQRAAESLARVKAIREGSRVGKLVCSKVDARCGDELQVLLRGLSRVGQEIRALLPPPAAAPPRAAETGGLMRGPPPPLRSQGRLRPPRRLPWVSSQSQPPSLPILRASCMLLPQPFSLTSPPVQQPSSLQAVSRMLLRHTQLSQRSSSMVRPQADAMPIPNEAHQYSYQSQHGMAAITGNISGQTSPLPSPPPPPPPPPTSALQIPSQRSVQVEIPSQAPDVPSQSHANPHSVLETNEVPHLFGGIGGDQQQPSPGCPSDSNGKTYEWLSKTLLESSSEGGSSSDEDDGVGDSLGGMDWLGDN